MPQAPADLFVEGKSGRQKLPVGAFIAAGTFGAVYSLQGAFKGKVLKLFNTPEVAIETAPKLRWMAGSRPPLMSQGYKGKDYPQLAWPMDLVLDKTGQLAGFTMPEIDLSSSVGLEWIMERSGRAAKRIPEHYRFRLHIAQNLAALFDSLHGVGVCVIDVKPDNIRFYTDTGFICLLDCDSFILSDPKQPTVAAACTPGYILPEAKTRSGGHEAGKFREEQDRFALAILIFRLMNEGLSPFQGKIKDPAFAGQSLEVQPRIDAGLYPYAIAPSRRIEPAAQSLHKWFDDATRRLFDRAFASKSRPTAKEWADHLARYSNASSGALQVCKTKPKEHVHFGKGCGLCASERAVAALKQRTKSTIKAKAAKPSPPVTPPRPTQAVKSAPIYASSTISTPSNATTTGPTGLAWKIPACIGGVLVIGAMLFGGDSTPGKVQTASGETVYITAFPSPWSAQVLAGRAVNVRSGPGSAYQQVVPTLSPGSTVTITGHVAAKDGRDWYYVQLPDGSRGFVAGWVADKSTASTSALAAAADAAAAAQAPQSTADQAYPEVPAPSPAQRESKPSQTYALQPRARQVVPQQYAVPAEEESGPRVACILPNGSERNLSLTSCRNQGGTIYQ